MATVDANANSLVLLNEGIQMVNDSNDKDLQNLFRFVIDTLQVSNYERDPLNTWMASLKRCYRPLPPPAGDPPTWTSEVNKLQGGQAYASDPVFSTLLAQVAELEASKAVRAKMLIPPPTPIDLRMDMESVFGVSQPVSERKRHMCGGKVDVWKKLEGYRTAQISSYYGVRQLELAKQDFKTSSMIQTSLQATGFNPNFKTGFSDLKRPTAQASSSQYGDVKDVHVEAPPAYED
jgi:hypothetical protein